MENFNSAIVALNALSPNHHDRVAEMTRLRNLLHDEFKQTGNIQCLERAIQVGEMAVEATLPDDPNGGNPLSNLGTLLYKLFERTGAIKDLDRAIELSEKAVAVTAPDHIDRGAWLTNLGNRLRNRFEWTKQIKDLDRAIKMGSLAVDITARGHQNQASRLNNLAIMFDTRFDAVGDIKDLISAVEISTQAKNASPSDDPHRVACLVNLGNHLGSLYQQTGSMEHLNQAIDAAEEAMKSLPYGSPDRGAALSNFANWLGTRYDRTGDMEDLTSAIQFSQMAVLALSPGDPNKGPYLDNTGLWLGALFKRTGNKHDIDLAIENSNEALNTIPAGHPGRIAALFNLGSRLGQRFERFGEIEDIRRAVEITEVVLQESSLNPSKQYACCNNLGTFLQLQFKRTGHMADLNRAIQLTEEATKGVSPSSVNRAQWLGNLASHLETRFEHTKSPVDIEQALLALKEGYDCQNAPPSTRITLAFRACVLLSDQSKWDESSELIERAVALLTTITQRSIQYQDKQHILSQFSGLASFAAVAALNANKDPCHALQLLELGRGIIAGLLLEMRADISALREQDARLAKEFVSLRDKLDTSVNGRQGVLSINEEGISHSFESRAKQRREAEEQLEKVLQEIRSKSGFQSFLLPPNAEELRAAAASGPVVVINATSYRCDAFLVRQKSPITVLQLPKLHIKDIEHNITSLETGNLYDSQQALEWLWDAAASPILDALGYTQPPTGDNWPRVWWIPTGKLRQLPFHAAGQFRDSNNTCSVLDRVMSSYSPSLKSLVYGRQAPNASLSTKVLIVTVPGSGLPFATAEASMLEDLCPSLGLNPVRLAAIREDIVRHLGDCKIFHFAGHGLSHDLDPSHSRLVLSNGGSLTVDDLRDCKLQETSPFLAYLSACSTKVNMAESLVDEDIHLVNACQLAGFRHVVGTLWKVSDMHCISVAKTLYETIGNEGMTDLAVCRGLHRATKQLRDRGAAITWEMDKSKTKGDEGTVRESTNQSLVKGVGVDNLSVHHDQLDNSTVGVTTTRDGFGVGSYLDAIRYSPQSRGHHPRLWAAYIHVGV